MKSEALLKSHEVRRRDLLILKFVYCLLFICKKKGMVQRCWATQIVGLNYSHFWKAYTRPFWYFNDLDPSGFSGRQVHCGQQGQQGGQDQGGGWHDPYPGFSKIFKSGPNVSKSVLEWSKSIFWVFLTVTHILDHFLTALDTFEKNGLRVMSASSLVLSSLLSLLSTVHLPTRESWRV